MPKGFGVFRVFCSQCLFRLFHSYTLFTLECKIELPQRLWLEGLGRTHSDKGSASPAGLDGTAHQFRRKGPSSDKIMNSRSSGVKYVTKTNRVSIERFRVVFFQKCWFVVEKLKLWDLMEKSPCQECQPVQNIFVATLEIVATLPAGRSAVSRIRHLATEIRSETDSLRSILFGDSDSDSHPADSRFTSSKILDSVSLWFTILDSVCVILIQFVWFWFSLCHSGSVRKIHSLRFTTQIHFPRFKSDSLRTHFMNDVRSFLARLCVILSSVSFVMMSCK